MVSVFLAALRDLIEGLMMTNDEDDIEPPPRSPLRPRSGSGLTWRVVLLIAGSVLLIWVGLGTALVFRAVQQARAAALREQDKNNLQQIGLALHYYHEMYNRLPAGGIVREDGTEMLSWQASLLPFLGQAPLARQIQPDFAWYSPENRAVFSQPIAVLMNPAMPVQPRPAVSHYAGNSHIFEINMSTDYRHISDGMSYTIAAGDVSAGCKPWGDPTNVRDPGRGIGNSSTQFGSPFPGGCHFLMMDGSVKFITENIDRQTLLDLATPAGYDWGEDASF